MLTVAKFLNLTKGKNKMMGIVFNAIEIIMVVGVCYCCYKAFVFFSNFNLVSWLGQKNDEMTIEVEKVDRNAQEAKKVNASLAACIDSTSSAIKDLDNITSPLQTSHTNLSQEVQNIGLHNKKTTESITQDRAVVDKILKGSRDLTQQYEASQNSNKPLFEKYADVLKRSDISEENYSKYEKKFH